MKIDASRYTMFWTNPDRYRLRECWKISPVDPNPNTFAGLMTYGRRRGTAFHDIRDGLHQGKALEAILADLKERNLGETAIKAALRMAEVVNNRFPNEAYLAHEAIFEYPIPDSPHILTGRLDHLLDRDGEVLIGDWKTSKYRTKADFRNLVAKYCGSPQVDFYLLGSRTLGFDCRRFIYRLVQDAASNKSPRIPSYSEHVATRDAIALRCTERSVHQTCELIEFMKATFGLENHWPNLYEAFDRGYSPILGKKMYEGFIPDGFQPKVEHLETMMDDEPEAEGDLA